MNDIIADPPDATPGASPPNATTAASDADAIGQLAEIERNIEKTLPPKLKQAYSAIIVAGRQLMFSERTHAIMEEYMGHISSPDDVPKIVAHGVMKILGEIDKQTQGKMSRDASAPAAVTLMTYGLKYVDGKLGIPVTKAMIDETTRATITGLFALYKVSPEQIQQAMQARYRDAAQGGPTPAASAVQEGTV